MKKLVVAGTVIGTIVIAAVLWIRMEKTRGQENLRGVGVVPVTRGDIGTAVKATGVIKPMVGAQVNVGSSASGVVTHLYVRIGDKVQKIPFSCCPERCCSAGREMPVARVCANKSRARNTGV